jgi:hypothetical protein
MKKNRKGHKASTTTAPEGVGLAAPKRRLELYREPTSPVPRVRFLESVFAEDWQNSLARASAQTALEILEDRRDADRLQALGAKLLASMSGLAAGLIERGQAGPIACGDGCDFCCHQIVGATPLEVFVIWVYLEQTRPDLGDLKRRARDLAQRATGVSPSGRYSRSHPCVFLEDQRCSIYEVRPLTCRGVNALDRDICRDMLDDETRHRAFWERGEGSPGYAEPLRGAHALSAGLQIALSELYGLDMHPVDLTLAIDLALSTPDWSSQWRAGASPLKTVRSGQGLAG